MWSVVASCRLVVWEDPTSHKTHGAVSVYFLYDGSRNVYRDRRGSENGFRSNLSDPWFTQAEAEANCRHLNFRRSQCAASTS